MLTTFAPKPNNSLKHRRTRTLKLKPTVIQNLHHAALAVSKPPTRQRPLGSASKVRSRITTLSETSGKAKLQFLRSPTAVGKPYKPNFSRVEDHFLKGFPKGQKSVSKESDVVPVGFGDTFGGMRI